MKIDHIVVNVGEKYQKDNDIINGIKEAGFPYEQHGVKELGDLKLLIFG